MRLLLVFFLTCLNSYSQGLYQDFGQNTTQKNKTAYSLKQDLIEIIYFSDGEELARVALQKALEFVPEYESRLNYNLSNGIRIIVYNHFDDYKKSNTNITNPQYYAGGYSTLNENSSVVYFDGSRVNYTKQLRKAVAEVIINEFIFGGNIRERIQTAALLTLPDWYYKGLVAYLAESWNVENDNFLKDFFQNKKQKYFTSLQEEDEILAGHSIWRYLEEKNGKGAVSNIVFLTRIGRSVENAVIYYTGLNITNLLESWKDFYLEKYKTDEIEFKYPKGQENAPEKLAKKRHTQFKLSNDGNKVAIVTNNLGRYQVVLYDIKSKSMQVIARGGHQLLNRDIDLNYPLIAWNPTDNTLGIVIYKNENTVLKRYNTEGKQIEVEVLKNVPFVKGFAYSPDGSKIIFSVIRTGQTDLLLYDVKSKQSEFLSNDKYDNLSPRFTKDGNSILFVSNQYYLEERESNYYSIFSYNLLSKSKEFIVGNPEEKINSIEPIELNDSVISYLSDKNGIVNNFFFVRQSKESFQLTNYKRCIIHNDVAPNSNVIADLLYFNNRYRIYIGNIAEDFRSEAIINAASTSYRKWLNNHIDISFDRSSLKLFDTLNLADTSVDSISKKRLFISGFKEKDDIIKTDAQSNLKHDPYITIAKTHFGIEYFLQQFDKSILNNYLFPAGVNEKIYNYPLLSPHFQTCISDVLKNHVITAGFRIPIRIKASDYYINYSNRKGRWNKEISAFRRARIFDQVYAPVRMVNSQFKVGIHYPFNERSRIAFTAFTRDDRVAYQATDSFELIADIKQSLYFGHGIEYVFDNVRSNGLNLFQGLRFKIYSENYHRNGTYQFISNNGIDLRWYRKLHRQIYFAARLNAAFSFGTQTTAYYMGGVENWLVNVDTNSNFNYKIPTLTGSEYAFQTIASPVRGFYRNSRAGNKFVLMNMEVRVPLFAYLIQKPITSEFFRSIMLIGFVDIGTAWNGRSPYSIQNPFNTRIVQAPLYSVSVISQRDPFLYAFGIGARAKILGHYIKFDHGWGLIENKLQAGLSTFSIGLDF